jgi:hypothetical protein
MDTRDPDDLPADEVPAPAPGPLDVEGLVRKFQKELNSGLIALVLLSVLERAQEDRKSVV